MEYLLDAQSLRMFVQQRVFPIPGRPTIKIFFVSVIKNVLWPSRCFVFPTRPGIDFQILRLFSVKSYLAMSGTTKRFV